MVTTGLAKTTSTTNQQVKTLKTIAGMQFFVNISLLGVETQFHVSPSAEASVPHKCYFTYGLNQETSTSAAQDPQQKFS